MNVMRIEVAQFYEFQQKSLKFTSGIFCGIFKIKDKIVDFLQNNTVESSE